jgi:hypothetical protein
MKTKKQKVKEQGRIDEWNLLNTEQYPYQENYGNQRHACQHPPINFINALLPVEPTVRLRSGQLTPYPLYRPVDVQVLELLQQTQNYHERILVDTITLTGRAEGILLPLDLYWKYPTGCMLIRKVPFISWSSSSATTVKLPSASPLPSINT